MPRRKLLYVGKARNLKNRVGSYFRASGLTDKTMALVARIRKSRSRLPLPRWMRCCWSTTSSRATSRLTTSCCGTISPTPTFFCPARTSIPRVSLHRGAKRRKGQYFGPYPSAGAVRESLHFLQKVFKVRQCEDSYFSNRSRPCLQYQIDRCTAPCVDLVTEEEYADRWKTPRCSCGVSPSS